MTTIRFAFYDPFAEVMYRFPTFQQAEEIAIKMGGTRVVELEDDQVIRRWRLENGDWQAINIRPRGSADATRAVFRGRPLHTGWPGLPSLARRAPGALPGHRVQRPVVPVRSMDFRETPRASGARRSMLKRYNAVDCGLDVPFVIHARRRRDARNPRSISSLRYPALALDGRQPHHGSGGFWPSRATSKHWVSRRQMSSPLSAIWATPNVTSGGFR